MPVGYDSFALLYRSLSHLGSPTLTIAYLFSRFFGLVRTAEKVLLLPHFGLRHELGQHCKRLSTRTHAAMMKHLRARVWCTARGSNFASDGSGLAPSRTRNTSAHNDPLFCTVCAPASPRQRGPRARQGKQGRTSGNLTSNSATRRSFQSPNVMFCHTRLGRPAALDRPEKTSPVGDVERWTCIASGSPSGHSGAACIGAAAAFASGVTAWGTAPGCPPTFA